MKKLGIVGVGGVALYAHLPSYEQNKIKVWAICDQNKAILDYVGDKFGINRRYQSAEEMLENEKLEYVDIATPPNTHLHLLKIANKYKVKVVMQKPFIVNSFELEQAVKLIDESQAFILNLSGSYVSAWEKIKELLETNDLGKPLLCTIINQDWWDRDKNRWDLDIDNYIIFEMLIHHLDLCVKWFGFPSKVTARGNVSDGQRMKKTNIVDVMLEYDSGLIIQLVENWAMSQYDFACGHPFEDVLITCDYGCIKATSESVKYSKINENIISVWKYPRPGQKLPCEMLHDNWFCDSFGKAMNDYLNLNEKNEIKKKKKYAIDITKLTFKIVEATRSDKWIKIDLD